VNIYSKLSVFIALGLYLPLSWQILTKRVTQNLATFILWALLDLVVAISIWIQGGNWTLPAAYVCGCLLVIGCLIKLRTVSWTKFETGISIIVLVCLAGWIISGPRMATILSTTGVVLAGIPQLADSYKNPKNQPFLVYLGFTVANGLSVLAGNDWSIEERFYGASCALLTLAITLVIGRKFLPRYSSF